MGDTMADDRSDLDEVFDSEIVAMIQKCVWVGSTMLDARCSIDLSPGMSGEWTGERRYPIRWFTIAPIRVEVKNGFPNRSCKLMFGLITNGRLLVNNM